MTMLTRYCFRLRSLFVCSLVGLFATGCLEPYAPPAIENTVDLFVVDGFLNQTDASISVRLSHAVALDDGGKPPVEAQAVVQLEEKDGNTILLYGDGTGNYTAAGLSINPEHQYRLHIRTMLGKEYYSDYVDVNPTPDIDSVTWRPSASSITLYTNTHDDSGKSRYYLWRYTETFQYRSPYEPGYRMTGGKPDYIAEVDRVGTCWTTKNSTSILVGSSERLSSDVIRDFPLTVIAAGGDKLSVRYSILVEQRTLSKDAYTFWTELQKTTESLGGLFDPLPSQVVGNVHSNDLSEPVLGYFSAGQQKSERLFISFYELPDYLQIYPRVTCQIDSIPLNRLQQYGEGTYFISPYGVPSTIGYTISSSFCMDCRVKGGVTKKPDFWK
ncbi:DUF4249 domain-containing protein [Chryseolinea lacunae]|uniref:DUF4249 domain-containing protein n=1 Tax=Chryseolinea lacunae TaxID=2801331 RepID=A0ABS1L2J1_9BACT|nr:DUF4249 domain-containing protein [Chryseolinea lacunae]MBL0745162.1 DUF4249 domain-containing protein [Chryseolinea lacunae]